MLGHAIVPRDIAINRHFYPHEGYALVGENRQQVNKHMSYGNK